jgi:hypothetical protein
MLYPTELRARKHLRGTDGDFSSLVPSCVLNGIDGRQPVESVHGGAQVRRREVRVPNGHLHVGVAEDLLDVLQTGATHHHVAHGGVAEIVEPEAFDLGACERGLEGRADLTPGAIGPAAEHQAGPLLGIGLEGHQGVVDGCDSWAPRAACRPSSCTPRFAAARKHQAGLDHNRTICPTCEQVKSAAEAT